MSLNVEVLEKTFALIKPQAPQFAASFYETLFTDYPEVQPLFAATSLPEQQKKLVGALALVIAHLRNPVVLTEALRGLGERHVKYGVLPEHYPMVGAVLLKTLEAWLGTDWTPQVGQAWSDAYAAVCDLMAEAA